MIVFRSAARNVSIVAISYAVMWTATFAFTVAQARYLEPARFGELSLALSYMAFLAIAVDFGLGTQLSRMVAQNAAGREDALAATIAIRSALWLVAMPLLWLVTIVLGYDRELVIAIVILGVSELLISVGATVAAYLQGREEFLVPSIASVALRASAAVLGITVLAVRPDIAALAAVFVIAAAIYVAVLLVGLRAGGHAWAPRRVEGRSALRLLGSAVPIGSYFIVASFYFNVDMAMLDRLAPAENVGWYAAAYRLFIAATIVPAIVNGMVLYPVLSRLSLGPREELRALVGKALTFLVLSGMAAALVLGLFADTIVTFLYPGDEYAEAANALRLLAPGLPLLYLNSVFSYTLFALRRERSLLVMATAFAILNPLANFVAIPLLRHEGAALVTTVTELGLLLWLVRLMPGDLVGRDTFRLVAKASVAALAASGVVGLAQEPAAMRVLIALAVYGAAAIALRAVAPSDLRAVLALARVERR